MKLQNKLSLLAIGLVAFSSCEKHDPFDDHGTPGQLLPTCYWEVGSTAVKAGEEYTFKGQYYTEHGQTPSRSEVWYSINQEDEASATLKLTGSFYSYTQTVASTQEVRSTQCVAEFDHSLAQWDGYEYVITGSVPTSTTLAPVSWNPKVWDQANYDRYYPEQFADSFMTVVKSNIMTETGNYPSALRTVYASYEGFTNEFMEEINNTYGVNFPTNAKEGEKGQTRSDFWFFSKDDDQKTVRAKAVAKYVNADGTDEFEVDYDVLYKKVNPGRGQATATHEDSLLYNAMVLNPNVLTIELEGHTGSEWYAVYKSSEWLYCRYVPEQASILTAIKEEYVDAVKAMLDIIPFDAWVYNSADANYAVAFTRKFILTTSFKVVDTDGNVGKASTDYTLNVN